MVDFTSLPKDIHELFMSYLGAKSLLCLARTCKLLQQRCDNSYYWVQYCDELGIKNVSDNPKEHVKMWYSLKLHLSGPSLHHYVANMIGLEKFFRFPELKLHGGRDYIDWLKATDVSAPVMRGVDCYARPFLTLRYTRVHTHEPKVVTVFQRYSNTSFPWCNGTYYGCDLFMHNCMNQEMIDKMITLLQGKSGEDDIILV